jgi:hypothetical protein
VRFLLVAALTLALALAGAEPARAQSFPHWLSGFDLPGAAPQTPHPAVARVIVPVKDGYSFGSGSLVSITDRYALVITNWHVVDGAVREPTVVFPGGFRSAARIVKIDHDWDLAALSIWKPPVAPVRLSTQAPRPGDLLTIAGYGSGSYRAASGRCTQYVAPGVNFPYEMVELAAKARQGDSGGPIFNAQGELAGVLFGEGGGRTSGSYCGRVQRFLASIVPGAPTSTPETQPGLQELTDASRGVPLARMTGLPAATSPSAVMPNNSLRPAFDDFHSPLAAPIASDVATPLESNSSQTGVAGDEAWRSGNRFRDEPPAAAPEQSLPASDWSAWIGTTAFEQLKAALAVVGLVAMLLHGLRWLRTG